MEIIAITVLSSSQNVINSYFSLYINIYTNIYINSLLKLQLSCYFFLERNRKCVGFKIMFFFLCTLSRFWVVIKLQKSHPASFIDRKCHLVGTLER